MSFSLTCSRPYSAARSSGVSCWLFLIVGSVSSWSSTETTSECPYWAAQWSAVSLSWFCGRMKGKKDWQQEGRKKRDERRGGSGCRNYGKDEEWARGRWSEESKRGKNMTEEGWSDAVRQRRRSKVKKKGRWWQQGENEKKVMEEGLRKRG